MEGEITEYKVVPMEQHGVINFEEYAMSMDNVVKQVGIIQNIVRAVMKENEHFGTIPGTKKPSLYKPGAEKLSLTFRLRPEYQIRRTDMANDHREYEVTCTLYHIPTGQSIGEGVGSATTMEGKYRYRTGGGELTELPVPKAYWDTRKTDSNKAMSILKSLANEAGHDGDRFGTKKNDTGSWMISTYSEKVEHDNPADYWNTVLKMAKKRAHVDAILTATAASDIFTQDVEDMPEVIPQTKSETKKEPEKEPIKQPQQKQENNSDTISEAQRKRLYALYKKGGKTDEQLKDLLKNTYNIEHSTDIKKVWYDELCAWAEKKMETVLCPKLNNAPVNIENICSDCQTKDNCGPYKESQQ